MIRSLRKSSQAYSHFWIPWLMKSGCALSCLHWSQRSSFPRQQIQPLWMALGRQQWGTSWPTKPPDPQMNLEYLTVFGFLGCLYAAGCDISQGLFHAIPNASLHFMAMIQCLRIWYSFISSPDFFNIPIQWQIIIKPFVCSFHEVCYHCHFECLSCISVASSIHTYYSKHLNCG